MRLGIARTAQSTAVVLDDDQGVRLLPFADLASAMAAGVLERPGRFAGEPVSDIDALDLAAMVGPATKVICVGHNYRAHIVEMGHELPLYPNIFSKFPEAMVGPRDPIALSPASSQWDWEAELAVVIGRPASQVSESDAGQYIAGYTVANDVSARDWQRRSTQWLMGKTFEASTPVGPWLVTSDEVDPDAGLDITCTVDGVEKQRSNTSDLLFKPAFLVSYLSQVLTLQPGDVVLTGTPGGVGSARIPPETLRPGQELRTAISQIGELVNRCISAGNPSDPRLKGVS